MFCKSDVKCWYTKGLITPNLREIVEGQNPQIKRPVRIPAIPVSRFRAGKVTGSIESGGRKSTA
jgi:hypothetical protein